MEEEKKDNKGLKVIFILFLLLCLAGSCVFIYKRISLKPQEKEEQTEEKVEIPNLSNILKMIPVKRENAKYIGYKVSELTDKEINNAVVTYIVNNTELTTKDNEKYYLEKLSNIEDNLFNFLGLNNYSIKYEDGNDDIRYKMEKVTENDIEYVKVKLTEIATDAFDTYELQDLNNITYNEEKKEYTVKVLVMEYPGGGPELELGEANIILKSSDGKTILQEVQFNEQNPVKVVE